MALEPRHNPSDEPARLAHLDDRDWGGGFIECGERSAQVVRLSHGAPTGCCCRAKVACPCSAPPSIYKRPGPTTLFAALNTLDGVVLGRCIQRHTHQEFIRFLNAVERAVPAGKLVHAVLDNYGTHKHPKVKAWLTRHPRRPFHFTPKSGSWLNAVEGFFSKLTRQRIRRGVFRSIVDLQAAINRYLAEHNHDPNPFAWTKPADAILAKLNRLPVPSVWVSALV